MAKEVVFVGAVVSYSACQEGVCICSLQHRVMQRSSYRKVAWRLHGVAWRLHEVAWRLHGGA